MLNIKNIKFRGPDKKPVKSEEMYSDYISSPAIGRARLGKAYFYYRDLGKKYYIPYDYIDQAFTRISECTEDEFGNSAEYFRLVLMHGGKEFANLIFEKRTQVEDLKQELVKINPAIELKLPEKKR